MPWYIPNAVCALGWCLLPLFIIRYKNNFVEEKQKRKGHIQNAYLARDEPAMGALQRGDAQGSRGGEKEVPAMGAPQLGRERCTPPDSCKPSRVSGLSITPR
jgi:hypothetical protein